MILNAIIISLLTITSISDLRKRSISNKVLILYGILLIPVFFWRCHNQQWEAASSIPWGIIPGLICLIIGKITRESIGFGDGYLISIIGMYIGLEKTISLILIAVFMIALCSIALLIVKRVNGKTELPFVPALLVAYGLQSIVGG